MDAKLKLLYKLMLDGGKVIQQFKEGDTYWIVVEPVQGLTAGEYSKRYGTWNHLINIPLSPDLKGFYEDMLSNGWNTV